MKIIKFLSKFFVFVCLSFVALYVLLNNYFDNSTQENYRYSIATLTKTTSRGKGGWGNEYNYIFKNSTEKGRGNITEDSVEYYKSKIGSTFLIKIHSNKWVNKYFFTSRIYINKPAPDNIKEAPSEGWKELPKWAK